jgi:iron complex outermembrane receptor protein
VLDPKLCPVFSDTNGNCERYVAYISGQNPDLKAEKSKSLTLGAVFEPVPHWSLAVDAFDIKRRNEISTISSKYLLDHEAKYGNLIERSAITGQIDKLSLLSLNLAETKVRGVDLDARGRIGIGQYGALTITGSYNRMHSYKTAEVPEGDLTEYAGFYDLPKNRAKAGLVWDLGNWQSSVNLNFTGQYSQRSSPDTVCSFEAKNPAYCTIGSWLTADAYIGYRGFKNWDLSLSVQNVANKEAPFDAGRLAYLLGYNSSYHNQMGRNIQISAKYTFF